MLVIKRVRLSCEGPGGARVGMDPWTGWVTRDGCEWLSSGTGLRPSPNAFSSCISASCFQHRLWEASWGLCLFLRLSFLMLPVGEPFPDPPRSRTNHCFPAFPSPPRQALHVLYLRVLSADQFSVQTARLMNESAGRGRGAGQGDSLGW